MDTNSEISHCISIRPRNKKEELNSNDLFNSYKSMAKEMNIGEIDLINNPLNMFTKDILELKF